LRTRAYQVEVERGTAIVQRVKGPYVAETFPVTAEGEYVVIELKRAA
jgi:3-phenylpropionate/trans-cinnamate dioxygenase ferredoxin subunit